MSSRPTRAVLGGTFDRLHAGHRALLAAAFAHADEVAIGLTTARYLADHPKGRRARLQSYRIRRSTLDAYLRRAYPGRRFVIVPLDDPVGGAVRPGVDVLVASRGTESGARWVNSERRRRGLPSVRLRLVPLVRADDLRPVSSTRIRAGTIDADGRRRSPVRVALVGLSRIPAATVRDAVARQLPNHPVVLVHRVRSSRTAGRSPAAAAVDRAARGRGTADFALAGAPASPGQAPEWFAVADADGPVGAPFRLRGGAVRLLERAIARRLAPRRRAWAGSLPHRGPVGQRLS